MALITRIRPSSTQWGYYYYWLVDKLKIKTNVRAVCPNANPTQNATITFFLNLISHAAKIKTQKLHQSCDRHVARNTVQLTLPLLPFSFSHSPSNPKPLARSKALTIHSFVRLFVHFLRGRKKKKMGGCTSKPQKPNPYAPRNTQNDLSIPPTPNTTTNKNNDAVNDDKQSHSAALSPFFPLYTPSPAYIFKKSLSGSKKGGNLTPMRVFRMPPSPAKHIKAVLRRRKSTKKSSAEEGAPEEAAPELDKRFGFSKEVTSRLEVGEEVGRGHFGYTCTARYKKGEHKDQKVAVKVIPKSKVSDRDDSIIKISFLFRKKWISFGSVSRGSIKICYVQ